MNKKLLSMFGMLVLLVGCFNANLEPIDLEVDSHSDGKLSIVNVKSFKDLDTHGLVVKGKITDNSSNPFSTYNGYLLLMAKNESGKTVYKDQRQLNLQANTNDPGLDRSFLFQIPSEHDVNEVHLELKSR